MDGLPVTEANTCDYVSTHPGKMHACGHDGHMAMLLSFSEYIDTVNELDHNVLLIFQPAEETLGGAEEICKSGIFTKYNVSQVFGIHLWPFLPKGVISSRRELSCRNLQRSTWISTVRRLTEQHRTKGSTPFTSLRIMLREPMQIMRICSEPSTASGTVWAI